MEEKDYDLFYVLIMLFFGVLILASTSYLLIKPAYTGHIIATGGNVTQANIISNVQALLWIGIQGNVTSNSSLAYNLSFSGGDLSFIYLYDNDPGTVATIIATTNDTLNPAALHAANHSDINSYLNISSDNPTSSEKTFRILHNFTIGGNTYELISAKTNSFLGDYYTGALMNDGDIAFVTDVIGGRGADNNSVDFQFLIPVSTKETYYFFTRLNTTSPLNCTTGFSPSSTLNFTEKSITINWEPIPGAESYTIFYTDNPTEGMLNFTGSPAITTLTTSLKDTPFGSTHRYYTIYANSSGVSCKSKEIIAATNQTLISLPGAEYSLVTFPYNFSNSTVENVFKSISNDYSNVYEFENEQKTYNIFIKGVWDEVHSIKPDLGYWVKTSVNTSLLTTGISRTKISQNLSPDYNLIGPPLIIGNTSVAGFLSPIAGKYDRVYEFDNINKAYKIFLVGVWDEVFNFKQDKGYYIRVTENVTFNST